VILLWEGSREERPSFRGRISCTISVIVLHCMTPQRALSASCYLPGLFNLVSLEFHAATSPQRQDTLRLSMKASATRHPLASTIIPYSSALQYSTMPPLALASPQESLASLTRRLTDLKSFQLPRLRGCKTLDMQREMAEEMRVDLEGVWQSLEVGYGAYQRLFVLMETDV
jgi:hypothetical protein